MSLSDILSEPENQTTVVIEDQWGEWTIYVRSDRLSDEQGWPEENRWFNLSSKIDDEAYRWSVLASVKGCAYTLGELLADTEAGR
jgi:hypothetical protein